MLGRKIAPPDKIVIGKRQVTKDEDLPVFVIFARRANGSSKGNAGGFEFSLSYEISISCRFRVTQDDSLEETGNALVDDLLEVITAYGPFTREIEDIDAFSFELVQPKGDTNPGYADLVLSLTVSTSAFYGFVGDDPIRTVSGRNDPADALNRRRDFGITLAPDEDVIHTSFEFKPEQD